jgi:hypothetical protein
LNTSARYLIGRADFFEMCMKKCFCVNFRHEAPPRLQRQQHFLRLCL